MCVLVIVSWVLCPFHYKVDHIVDRCVVGIPGLLTNVIVERWDSHTNNAAEVAGWISPPTRSPFAIAYVSYLTRRGKAHDSGSEGPV